MSCTLQFTICLKKEGVTMSSLSQIVGVGCIAERLGVPIHRVAYVIRTGKVKPLLVVGGRKLYSEAVVEQIAEVMYKMIVRKAQAAL
jgi:hypothetical protein